MAEEEKPKEEKAKEENKKNKKSSPLDKGIKITTVALTGLVIYGLCEKDIKSIIYNTEDSKTGKYLYLNDDAKIYGNMFEAINETNGKEVKYNKEDERFVVSTFYAYNGEYIRVDFNDPNYAYEEYTLINEGAIPLCYLLTTDTKNYQPEGFFKICDVKEKSKQKTIK